ncbi:MAG: hypothetical protein OXB90_03650 [Acidimicrobiaceae bacterium]|nr:hypothetical protein [Acidimicrobiaceae bacterium]
MASAGAIAPLGVAVGPYDAVTAVPNPPDAASCASSVPVMGPNQMDLLVVTSLVLWD